MNRYETHRAMCWYKLGTYCFATFSLILSLFYSVSQSRYELLIKRTEQQSQADKMALQVSEGKFIACRKSKLEIHR